MTVYLGIPDVEEAYMRVHKKYTSEELKKRNREYAKLARQRLKEDPERYALYKQREHEWYLKHKAEGKTKIWSRAAHKAYLLKHREKHNAYQRAYHFAYRAKIKNDPDKYKAILAREKERRKKRMQDPVYREKVNAGKRERNRTEQHRAARAIYMKKYRAAHVEQTKKEKHEAYLRSKNKPWLKEARKRAMSKYLHSHPKRIATIFANYRKVHGEWLVPMNRNKYTKEELKQKKRERNKLAYWRLVGDPERRKILRAQQVERRERMLQDPERCKIIRAQQEEYRKRMLQDPERHALYKQHRRERYSQSMAKLKSNPDKYKIFLERRREAKKKRMQDPVYREKVNAGKREYIKTEKGKAALARAARKYREKKLVQDQLKEDGIPRYTKEEK